MGKFNKLNNYLINLKPVSNIVEDRLVKKSFNIIEYVKPNSVNEAFLIYSAFNYLNFAVKQGEENKSKITYKFKGKIENLTVLAEKTNSKIKFYLGIDKNMSILYVKFEDFIFSFHRVNFKNKCNIEYFSSKEPIIFDNLKKQVYAKQILEFALKSCC